MKKTTMSLLIGAGLLATSIAASADVLNKNAGYYSTQHPQAVTAAVSDKAGRFPATDITVTNASSGTIYVVVPNTPINDTLYPNSNPDHIRNSNGAFYTTVMLQDANRESFFNQTVCPRALITVYGNIGNYKVNVDNEYCN